jgi:thiol-disulfide isomerase/thioredoxin
MSVTAYHFWSPTCAPCKVIKPAIEDLKEEFSNIRWVSVNTYSDPDNYAGQFNVTSVPTIVVVSPTSTERHSGTTMMGYYRIIRKSISSV